MIVMNLKVNNLYSFHNFEINMSYPRKVTTSMITGEHLEGKPNFRYKKVNIVMGANASGKSTFGQLITDIFSFISYKESRPLKDALTDDSKDASISIDFVLRDADFQDHLFRLDLNLAKDKDTGDILFTKIELYSTMINKSDNYEKCVTKLKQHPIEDLLQTESILGSNGEKKSWYITGPTNKNELISPINKEQYRVLLEAVLKMLDPSIREVCIIEGIKDSYVIKTKYHDIIIQEGQGVNTTLLSSGTQNGIELANTLYAIKYLPADVYYIDEKFSFIHSDIEKSIICQMINSLRVNSQLFITTHNYNILELPLPKHSFTFLKKEKIGNEYVIKQINAASHLKRDTDSLINAYKSDVFSTAPDVSQLDDLEY